MKNKTLKAELVKTLWFCIKTDLEIHGSVQDNTRRSFEAQGVEFPRLYKLVNPQPGEEQLVYRITSYNEATNRAYITPVNSPLPLPGEELVSMTDIEELTRGK